MKTISLKQFENFRWLFTFSLGILVTSCGTYQNSSYYDNDGVYGSSSNTQTSVVQNDNANSEYYKNYFSNLNQESQETFTNVDNYTTPVDTTTTAAKNSSSGYNGWGQNTTDVTVNYYDGFGAGWNGWYSPYWGAGWYGSGWGWNNGWGWNSWYGPGWGWNTGWGWNSWYGAGWGWGGWYTPYYGYGYGYPYYGNYGWASNYGYNGGRRNTVYRNNVGGLNGNRVANGFTRSNTAGPRTTPGVRPTNLGIRPNNGGVRNTTVVNNGSPRPMNNSTSVGNVRNNSVQNVTPTRTESTPRNNTPTRSYSPSSSSYGGGSYGGGGGSYGGGGGGRSGGGGRR